MTPHSTMLQYPSCESCRSSLGVWFGCSLASSRCVLIHRASSVFQDNKCLSSSGLPLFRLSFSIASVAFLSHSEWLLRKKPTCAKRAQAPALSNAITVVAYSQTSVLVKKYTLKACPGGGLRGLRGCCGSIAGYFQCITAAS